MKFLYIRRLKQVFILSLPVIFVLLANIMVNAHFKSLCLIKLLFHRECWGCGLTRAVVALSHFDFKLAYQLNPLIFIIVPLLFIYWFYLIKITFSKSSKTQ